MADGTQIDPARVENTHRRLKALAAVAVSELQARAEAAGIEMSAFGLSLFLVGPEDASVVMQASALAGDVDAIFMFGPDWPWQLTADLVTEEDDADDARRRAN